MNKDEIRTLFVLTGAVRKQAFNYLSALPWYAFSKRKAAVRQWRMWYQLEEEYAHLLYLDNIETFRERWTAE